MASASNSVLTPSRIDMEKRVGGLDLPEVQVPGAFESLAPVVGEDDVADSQHRIAVALQPHGIAGVETHAPEPGPRLGGEEDRRERITVPLQISSPDGSIRIQIESDLIEANDEHVGMVGNEGEHCLRPFQALDESLDDLSENRRIDGLVNDVIPMPQVGWFWEASIIPNEPMVM